MIYDTNKYENINNFIFLRSVRDEKAGNNQAFIKCCCIYIGLYICG